MEFLLLLTGPRGKYCSMIQFLSSTEISLKLSSNIVESLQIKPLLATIVELFSQWSAPFFLSSEIKLSINQIIYFSNCNSLMFYVLLFSRVCDSENKNPKDNILIKVINLLYWEQILESNIQVVCRNSTFNKIVYKESWLYLIAEIFSWIRIITLSTSKILINMALVRRCANFDYLRGFERVGL